MRSVSDEEVKERLTAIPGWEVEGKVLTRRFTFASYMDGVEFVRAVAGLAVEMGHYPDMILGSGYVVVSLTTHAAGGITDLDLEMAGRISRCLAGGD